MSVEAPAIDPELEIIRPVLDRATQIIDEEYGPEGRQPLDYHNVDHTLAAVYDTIKLADLAIKRGNLDPRRKKPLLVGMGFHDTKQGLGPGNNERASIDLADQIMIEEGGYSQEDRDYVGDVISGTVNLAPEGRVRQAARDSADYGVRLAADADLAPSGKPWDIYWKNFKRLAVELWPDKDVEGRDFAEFAPGQIYLLRQGFLTAEAEELFPHREENARHLEAMLKQLDG